MNPIDIKIALQGQQAVAAGLGQVSTGMKGLEGSVLGVGNALKGALSLGLLTQFARESYRAATESAVAVAQLKQSLTSAGLASNEFEQALMAQANALQDLTGFSDEGILSVQRLLVSFGATSDEVLKLTPLIADLAANLDVDLKTAARLVGSAIDGQVISLGKLNIQAKNASELADKLTKSVGGQAQALRNAKGETQSLATAFDDLQENVGRLLKSAAPSVSAPVSNLSSAVGGLADSLDNSNKSGIGLLATLARLKSALSPTEIISNFLYKGFDSAARIGVPVSEGLKPAGSAPVISTGDLQGPGLDGEFSEFRRRRLEQSMQFDEVYRAQLANERTGAELRNATLESYDAQLDRIRQIKVIDTELYQAGQINVEQWAERNAQTAAVTEQLRQQRALVQFQPDPNSASDNIYASIEELERRIGTAAQTVGRAFTNIAESSISSIADGLTGLFNQTLTWGQALDKIRTGIANGIVSAISRMFAEWVVGRTMVFIKELAFSSKEAAAKAPGALMTSISSYGVAAAVGVAALLAAIGALGGFSSGGYTGPGGRNDIAGAVHKGEVVFSQEDVAAFGGAAAVEQMRISRRVPGYMLPESAGGSSQGMGGELMAPMVVIVDDRAGALELMQTHAGKRHIQVVSGSTGARIDLGLNT